MIPLHTKYIIKDLEMQDVKLRINYYKKQKYFVKIGHID